MHHSDRTPSTKHVLLFGTFSFRGSKSAKPKSGYFRVKCYHVSWCGAVAVAASDARSDVKKFGEGSMQALCKY